MKLTFVLEHRSMTSFDFCSSSNNTFVLCTTVTRTHTHTHMYVYMRRDDLAGMNIKNTDVLDVRQSCTVSCLRRVILVHTRPGTLVYRTVLVRTRTNIAHPCNKIKTHF
jgi:hypothetical protein